jgi:hypothetical protein
MNNIQVQVLSLPKCPICKRQLITAFLIDENSAPSSNFAKLVSKCNTCESLVYFGEFNHSNDPSFKYIKETDLKKCFVITTIKSFYNNVDGNLQYDENLNKYEKFKVVNKESDVIL